MLTTKAALRGGAGLVTLATIKSLQTLVYSQLLEALTLPLEETPQGTIDVKALDRVNAYIKDRGVTAIVIGPGLTRQPQTARFVHRLTAESNLPMVLDADAINVAPVLNGRALRCLTPHRREFARLIQTSENAVIHDGLKLAGRFTRSHVNTVVVLKGHRTKVFHASQVWENTTGNPGMAKGGSGDVLSGLMGAFLAQHSAQKRSHEHHLKAILAAVYLHGLAGDLASRTLTQYAMNAEDIVSFLAPAMKMTLKR